MLVDNDILGTGARNGNRHCVLFLRFLVSLFSFLSSMGNWWREDEDSRLFFKGGSQELFFGKGLTWGYTSTVLAGKPFSYPNCKSKKAGKRET